VNDEWRVDASGYRRRWTSYGSEYMNAFQARRLALFLLGAVLFSTLIDWG
jgi:hypothetical protein